MAGKENPKPVTDYERARLRLIAFELLEGWGTTHADGGFKRWDMEERKARALKLADWALYS